MLSFNLTEKFKRSTCNPPVYSGNTETVDRHYFGIEKITEKTESDAQWEHPTFFCKWIDCVWLVGCSRSTMDGGMGSPNDIPEIAVLTQHS